MRDPYEILGVRRDATPEIIKATYRTLAMRYHPDNNGGDVGCLERLKEINVAYEEITDPSRNTGGSRWSDPIRPNPYQPQPHNPYSQSARTAQERAEQDFWKWAGASGPRQGIRNEDIHAVVMISLEECLTGCHRQILYAAEGRGAELASVQLAPGTHPGDTVVLRGGGHMRFRGAAGDLYATVEFKPHARFRADTVEKGSLETDAWMSQMQLSMGWFFEIRTLDSVVRVRIPPGATPGQMLRVKGHGLPVANNPRRGDLYVRVRQMGG